MKRITVPGFLICVCVCVGVCCVEAIIWFRLIIGNVSPGGPSTRQLGELKLKLRPNRNAPGKPYNDIGIQFVPILS